MPYYWSEDSISERDHTLQVTICDPNKIIFCAVLSGVWLFETPWTIAHQALCPWGFSRQEYWSGLPCPPPGDRPNPWIESRSPTLQADSFPSEPPGKPKNIVVGSLSLLQGNFPIQESNQGLLRRWILYQLSYQGIIFRLLFFFWSQTSWLYIILENKYKTNQKSP